VYEQLQAALQYTLAALAQLEGGDEEQQQEQQKQQEQQEQQSDAHAEGPAVRGAGAAADGAADGPGPAAAAEGDDAATPPVAAAGCRPRGGAAGNARMHPANRYAHTEPDFGALARQYPQLRPYVTTDAAGRSHLDTTSWAATRALTAALLRHDFGLAWWLPEGQLVPPVTNRANYLHWLADLLQLSAPPGGGPVRGLDVGCGANFVYCLLGAALYGWSMVGLDVTQVAVRCCRRLIADNPRLAHLLQVRDLSRLHPHLQAPAAAAPLGAGAQQAGPAAGRGRKRPAGGAEGEGGAVQVAEQGAAGGGGGSGGDDAGSRSVAGAASGGGGGAGGGGAPGGGEVDAAAAGPVAGAAAGRAAPTQGDEGGDGADPGGEDGAPDLYGSEHP
ncbi:Methyltransferase-like protein 16, partial [Tetrabaena socialis]